ncbi:unnamed protein product [Penicillium pancosmium]
MGVWETLSCWIVQICGVPYDWIMAIPFPYTVIIIVCSLQIDIWIHRGKIAALDRQLKDFKNVDHVRNLSIECLAWLLFLHDEADHLKLRFDNVLAPLENPYLSVNCPICSCCELAKKRDLKIKTELFETGVNAHKKLIETLAQWRNLVGKDGVNRDGMIKLLTRHVEHLSDRVNLLKRRVDIPEQPGELKFENVCICAKEK